VGDLDAARVEQDHGLPQWPVPGSRVDAVDATGIASWQRDLPFVMQNGFGRK
jgi:hypothetical protein